MPDIIHHDLRPVRHQAGTQNYHSTGAWTKPRRIAVAGHSITYYARHGRGDTDRLTDRLTDKLTDRLTG